MNNGFGKKNRDSDCKIINYFAVPFISVLCDMKCQAIVTSYERRNGFQYSGRGGDC